jgi:thioesterase domain-containing protein/acyl carrier protein
MNQKNVETIYPLSPSQQGMIFETLSALESGIHIEQSVGNLQGELNLVAFERSWQQVMKRHSLLRTSFVWKNQAEPLQVVLKEIQVPLTRQDWRGFSASQQQENLEAYLKEDRLRGFQLTKAPLMRLALFAIDDSTYQFVWSHHHILMDGWCLPLILKEFLEFYEAFGKDEDLQLAPSRPYRDYIIWQKQQDLSQAEKFWRKMLQGFKRPTPLGTTVEPFSLPDTQERYGQQKVSLSVSTTAALQNLVRQNRLTLNNLIQGVWALLLSRYSGELDVVFGTTVSGRPPDLIGVESMVGLFINTLPVRFKVGSDRDLWSWLKDTQTQHLDRPSYEYCSAGQVHQWSEVPGYLPLYESILVFENYPSDSSLLQSQDLTIDIRNTRYIGAQTKYALTLLVIPGSQLAFQIVYDNHRFASSDIAGILEHLQDLLKSIVALPEQDLVTILETIPSDRIPKVIPLEERDRIEVEDGFIPPRDPLERQLVQIWEKILHIHPIGVRDRFFDLGGHSLLALTLMAQIQQQFGKNLPLATLFQYPTIEQMASLLGQQTDSLSWSSLVAIQPNGAKRPFFCVPGTGGNIIYFYDLARHLGSDRPFYGLQALGLDGESEPHRRLEDMAAHYIKIIQTVQPQGPYLLGGHSLGSWVAFEMARQLRDRGQTVALLAIMDTPAPCPDKKPTDIELDDTAWLIKIANLAERLLGKSLEVSDDDLHSLDPEEQLNYLTKRLIAVDLLPPEAGIAQVRGLVQVFKANHEASARYVSREVYPDRISLFRASKVHPEDFARDKSSVILKHPDWGWGQLSAGSVDLHIVPGDHITMMAQPHVQVLAQRLRTCIEKAQVDNWGK